MGSLIDKDHTASAELVGAFKDLSRQSTATTKQSFKTILEILERGITPKDKEDILHALGNIKRQDKSMFVKVSELIGVGAIQGVAGNALYQILTNLSRSLP